MTKLVAAFRDHWVFAVLRLSVGPYALIGSIVGEIIAPQRPRLHRFQRGANSISPGLGRGPDRDIVALTLRLNSLRSRLSERCHALETAVRTPRNLAV